MTRGPELRFHPSPVLAHVATLVAALPVLAGGLGVGCGGSRALPGADGARGIDGNGGGDGGIGNDATDVTPTDDWGTAPVGCAVAVASGDSHVCVVHDDGAVYCMGENSVGQLGNGGTTVASSLARVPDVDAELMAAGGDHTCVTGGLGDGEPGVLCWGDNRNGELGVAGMTEGLVPVRVPIATPGGFVQISLGRRHSCALDSLFHGFCWGTVEGLTAAAPRQLPAIGRDGEEFLQLGSSITRVIFEDRLYDVPWKSDGTHRPVVTGAESGVVQNAVNANGVDCILRRGGTVWCRGGSYPPFYTIVNELYQDVAEVKVGGSFLCVRTGEGKVRCRGANESGQLGDGTLISRDSADPVVGLSNARELAVGKSHACARLGDGSVWCWGALEGSERRTLPQRISRPPSDRGCGDVPTQPSDGFRPALVQTRPADRLAEASLAWTHNLCLQCGGGTDSEACIRDEIIFMNGCVTALGLALDQYSACLAKAYWDLAACALTCGGTGPLPDQCLSVQERVGECGKTPGVLLFCVQNFLRCGTGTEVVDQALVCNGTKECPGGFDEANCDRGQSAFVCGAGGTVPLDKVFDGKRDCPDGSDE